MFEVLEDIPTWGWCIFWTATGFGFGISSAMMAVMTKAFWVDTQWHIEQIQQLQGLSTDEAGKTGGKA